MSPPEFRFSSVQAPIADPLCRAVTEHLSVVLTGAGHRRAGYVEDVDWVERTAMLDRGELAAVWICGLPYLNRHDVTLLAAPVMSAERYADQPVYFSDVIVSAASTFDSFDDLAGTRWAYNEPGSQSGYNITRHHLATSGRGTDFFGEFIESGSHESSLQMLLAGEIDATAIDSTVLEMCLADQPGLASRIRVIEVLGPSPAPAWVAHDSVPIEARETIRAGLLGMHLDPAGRAALRRHGVSRFVAVADADYDVIRQMRDRALSAQSMLRPARPSPR